MRTIAQVQADIERCVDSTRYDELQAEISAIHKEQVLAAAREKARAAAEYERLQAERRKLFKAHQAEVGKLYDQAKAEDLKVLPALTVFFEAVLSRYEAANAARVLEDALEQEGKALHEPFTRRLPELVGGANLKNSPGYQLRAWLQRYSDHRTANHGQPPSLDMLARSLRHSIDASDDIKPDNNF